VIFGNKNNIPITHSITASTINKASKYCIPTVFAVNASASELAGLKPKILIRPNKKKIINIDTRATGRNQRLKNAMSF
ncbi:hypothetical protein, partial [Campylobacter jejuni]|uniref:hypothetical protein n=1 Tax=Campylobacter jejuni TaxID=197 RepID=UPI002F960F68